MNLDQLKTAVLAEGKKFSVVEAVELTDAAYDARICIETTDPFHNNYFYEFVPLVDIAKSLGNHVTHFQYVARKENFDGLLTLSNGELIRVEITAAIDGYNDRLQMELLAERGHAPAFQKIEFEGNKYNRVFGKNELVAFESSGYDHGTLMPLLQDAVARKVDKAKSNADYNNAWLGVVFDDYLQPNAQKKKARFDPLCAAVISGVASAEYPFARTFFIGLSRCYIHDFGV